MTRFVARDHERRESVSPHAPHPWRPRRLAGGGAENRWLESMVARGTSAAGDELRQCRPGTQDGPSSLGLVGERRSLSPCGVREAPRAFDARGVTEGIVRLPEDCVDSDVCMAKQVRPALPDPANGTDRQQVVNMLRRKSAESIKAGRPTCPPPDRPMLWTSLGYDRDRES
jgi:hypothetical protein